MTWIQTYTGRAFDFADPRPQDVRAPDISHALSMQCRFNGHCNSFYSVAQHCVLAARLLRLKEESLAMEGLLHDAAEAYMGDLVRPLKTMDALEAFSAIEARVERIIRVRFGLPERKAPGVAEAVKLVDERLLATEKLFLMKTEPRPWQLKASPLTAQERTAIGMPSWEGWPPAEADRAWRHEFVESWEAKA